MKLFMTEVFALDENLGCFISNVLALRTPKKL